MCEEPLKHFPPPCKIRAESGFVLFMPDSLRVGTLDFLVARFSFQNFTA